MDSNSEANAMDQNFWWSIIYEGIASFKTGRDVELQENWRNQKERQKQGNLDLPIGKNMFRMLNKF